jgi:ferredoxin
MAKILFVDENECTGCEYCVDSIPEVFEMKNNVSHVIIQQGQTKIKYRK